MDISVKKGDDEKYTLSIKSGHFNGSLEGITKDSLLSLSAAILECVADKKTKEIRWNPRSQKHEVVYV